MFWLGVGVGAGCAILAGGIGAAVWAWRVGRELVGPQ